MSGGVLVVRHDFPLIELAPLAASFDQTVEEMIAGPPNTHPDITSAHFSACRDRRGKVSLFLAKPVQDREHIPVPEVIARLDRAGFVPADLPWLAVLKGHLDELWAAQIYSVGALGARSIWQGPDGGYAVYLITNPADRGFHLHWLEGDWGGETWFLVKAREDKQEPSKAAREGGPEAAGGRKG